MANRIAFVFPGQGGQTVGMGRDLYDNFTSSRSIFETANAVLGFDLTRLCFEGPEDELTRTINTQPALFVTSAAALAVIKEHGIFPAVVAGHSIGEYAALYAAGAITLEDALRLTLCRGELMQHASEENPGTMAAVIGLNTDGVRKAVEMSQEFGVVDAANFNSPGQVVISGEPAAVSKAGEMALGLGAKRAILLKVGGAFHSRLMKSAAAAMEAELQKANISDPEIPVVANVSADYVRSADEIRLSLAQQITGSVLWEDSIRKIAADGIDAFLELGAGTTLAGMIKRIVPDVPVASVGDKASLEAFLANNL